MASEMISYGKCVGVPGQIAPHRFKDGHLHMRRSHGLCQECSELTLHLFREYLNESRSSTLNKLDTVRVKVA